MSVVKVNKSEKIRQLFDEGYTIAEIHRKLGIRYQYAYNVVSYYVQSKARREVAADVASDNLRVGVSV